MFEIFLAVLVRFELDGNDALQPVGDRIGHDVRIRRPMYIERNDFTYVRNMPDGTGCTYEDMTNEQIAPQV